MSKSKVSMVDYIGYYSRKSGPVGHSRKVVNDYLGEFADELEMEVFVPDGCLSGIMSDHKTALPYHTSVEDSGSGTWENFLSMLKCFRNIRYALRHASGKVVWFYSVDQFLFMYLFAAGMHHKKVIVTLFAKEYPKGYHNFCLKKVLPRLGLVVSSNPEFDSRQCRSIYAPDYLYDEAVYDRYCVGTREKKVVCLGTMNPSKRIWELVKAFGESGIRLEIYGLFYDEEYYRKVLAACSDNIKIENRYLDYNEYLEILGSAEYCVLPYHMEAYANFTSGVLLECMYVGTVPVSDGRLLSKMGIQGIGYEKIEELGSFTPDESKRAVIMEQNKKLAKEKYHVRQFRQQIIRAVNELAQDEPPKAARGVR